MEQQDDSAPRDRTAPRPAGDRPRKKPYVKPVLTAYGSVAKLTQGTLTTQNDAFGGGKKMKCL